MALEVGTSSSMWRSRSLQSGKSLTLDREIHTKASADLVIQMNFKLHESIPTIELIDGFR